MTNPLPGWLVVELARCERDHGQARVLRDDERAAMTLMLGASGRPVVVDVGDGRYVTVTRGGARVLHDVKGPLR